MTASAPTAIAANLACVLYLLRHAPEATAEQAAAFHLLQGALEGRALRLRLDGDGLEVDGVSLPEQAPGVIEVGAQLRAHGIGELEAPAAVLGGFLRALVGPAGTFGSLHDLYARLDPVVRDVVTLRAPAYEVAAAADAPPPALASEAVDAPDTPTGTLVRDGAPAVEMVHFASGAHRTPSEVDALLELILVEPTDPALGDRLNAIVAYGDDAAGAGDWPEVVRIATALIRAEAAAPSEAVSRAYPVALRRLLPRSALDRIARLTTNTAHRAEAVGVLRRMGIDATDVLLEHLAIAPTIDERRAYYNALRQMTEGTSLLVKMLDHEEWYVVRNVADLCGELRLDEAVPALARRLSHEDERVRRAVAGALARIGTPPTTEPLRAALRDVAPAVRLQAVRGLDGWRSRGLAMTLSVLLDEENHPELVREMLLALGRIGSPEAVQSLVRASAPGGRLFSRKSPAVRLAAIEGLRLAGGATATAALQSLLGDDDPEIRAAAQKARVAVSG